MSRYIESSLEREDEAFEVPLRPGKLGEFIGQDSVRERLHVSVEAAKGRHEALGHCLFSGPPRIRKNYPSAYHCKNNGYSTDRNFRTYLGKTRGFGRFAK